MQKHQKLEAYIEKHYTHLSANTIGNKFNVSKSTVLRRAKAINLKFEKTTSYKIADSAMDEYILNHYYRMPAIDIAQIYGVSEKKINNRAKELNLSKKSDVGRFGQQKEILAFIKQHYLRVPIKSIASKFDVSEMVIKRLAQKLGLQKTMRCVTELAISDFVERTKTKEIKAASRTRKWVIDDYIKMHHLTMSSREIGAKIGVNYRTVIHWSNRIGITFPRKKILSKGRRNAIIKCLIEPKEVSSELGIARQYHISVKLVRTLSHWVFIRMHYDGPSLYSYPYSSFENELLRRYSCEFTDEQIAEKLNRPIASIKKKLLMLYLKQKPIFNLPYTVSENIFITENMETLTYNRMAFVMGRKSGDAVRYQAKVLGLTGGKKLASCPPDWVRIFALVSKK